MFGDVWDSWEIFGTPGDAVIAWARLGTLEQQSPQILSRQASYKISPAATWGRLRRPREVWSSGDAWGRLGRARERGDLGDTRGRTKEPGNAWRRLGFLGNLWDSWGRCKRLGCEAKIDVE